MSYCGECYYQGKKLKPCSTCYCGSEAKTELTNADRIRSMDDEELAELLPIVSDLMCQPTEECMKIICNHGECTRTKECALKWLQSEAE